MVLEIEEPTFIRRKVCYGEAVSTGEFTVEGITFKLVNELSEVAGIKTELY